VNPSNTAKCGRAGSIEHHPPPRRERLEVAYPDFVVSLGPSSSRCRVGPNNWSSPAPPYSPCLTVPSQPVCGAAALSYISRIPKSGAEDQVAAVAVPSS